VKSKVFKFTILLASALWLTGCSSTGQKVIDMLTGVLNG
jgi:uncharacterized lipoprotein YmbA